jgi:hypothetical protein
MTLLTETISHNPWTKGEMYYDRKYIESEPSRYGNRFYSFRTFSPQFISVGSGVSVGSDRFPNFKEEINV